MTASRGASTALLLTARHPDLVERMALIAPALDLAPDEDTGRAFFVERSHYEGWERYSAPSWRTDFEGFVRWFMAEVFNEPDSQATIDEMVTIALDADPEMLIRRRPSRTGTRPLPTSPRCAARCWSSREPTTRRWTSSSPPTWWRPCRRRSSVWLEGLGHRPDVRRPDLVNPLLLAFLA